MADYPPFMNAYGHVGRILEKIKVAKTPERFTYDYLYNTLGFKASSARAFIALAKRIGFLASDGTPTDLYRGFRNPSQTGVAMADAIRKGYPALYEKNEEAHKLTRKDLEGLFVELTGLEKGSSTLEGLVGTFEALKPFASFSAPAKKPDLGSGKDEEHVEEVDSPVTASKLGLNLAYSINLVLPKTDDVAVFNAIFKSLRDNLLRQ